MGGSGKGFGSDLPGKNANKSSQRKRKSTSTGEVKRGIATEIQEVFAVRMGPSYIRRMDAAARDRNITRSQLVKKAIWAYLAADLEQ
ncbi:MAG: hypothetical protein VKL98_05740 [Cyanobacteriota bacterium]|nr:hypothetical protein [Cyanobacteriota bacterium]